MRYLKKVIVPVLLNESSSKHLESLRGMDSLQHAEIHFVHVFNTITYAFGLGLVPLVYPIESDRKIIEESTISLLESIGKKALPTNFSGKIIHRILFSDDPKKIFTNYVLEESPNLLVIPTKAQHGIFESSFSAYVTKHTSCDVLILKHVE